MLIKSAFCDHCRCDLLLFASWQTMMFMFLDVIPFISVRPIDSSASPSWVRFMLFIIITLIQELNICLLFWGELGRVKKLM
jgi:hypothetical protein